MTEVPPPASPSTSETPLETSFLLATTEEVDLTLPPLPPQILLCRQEPPPVPSSSLPPDPDTPQDVPSQLESPLLRQEASLASANMSLPQPTESEPLSVDIHSLPLLQEPSPLSATASLPQPTKSKLLSDKSKEQIQRPGRRVRRWVTLSDGSRKRVYLTKLSYPVRSSSLPPNPDTPKDVPSQLEPPLPRQEPSLASATMSLAQPTKAKPLSADIPSLLDLPLLHQRSPPSTTASLPQPTNPDIPQDVPSQLEPPLVRQEPSLASATMSLSQPTKSEPLSADIPSLLDPPLQQPSPPSTIALPQPTKSQLLSDKSKGRIQRPRRRVRRWVTLSDGSRRRVYLTKLPYTVPSSSLPPNPNSTPQDVPSQLEAPLVRQEPSLASATMSLPQPNKSELLSADIPSLLDPPLLRQPSPPSATTSLPQPTKSKPLSVKSKERGQRKAPRVRRWVTLSDGSKRRAYLRLP